MWQNVQFCPWTQPRAFVWKKAHGAQFPVACFMEPMLSMPSWSERLSTFLPFVSDGSDDNPASVKHRSSVLESSAISVSDPGALGGGKLDENPASVRHSSSAQSSAMPFSNCRALGGEVFVNGSPSMNADDEGVLNEHVDAHIDRGVVGHEHVCRSEERSASTKWTKVFLMGISKALYILCSSAGEAGMREFVANVLELPVLDRLDAAARSFSVSVLKLSLQVEDRGVAGQELLCRSIAFSASEK